MASSPKKVSFANESEDGEESGLRGSNSQTFKLAKRALLKADSDTEKLCSLLVVTKSIDPQSISRQESRQLFEAIGYPFLYRLLISRNDSEDCSPLIYPSIASSVLATFLPANPDLIEETDVFKLFTRMSTLLSSLTDQNDEEKQMVDDILSCFDCFCLSANMSGSRSHQQLESLIGSGFLSPLVDLYVNSGYGSQKAYLILSQLASRHHWAQFDSTSFDKFILSVAREFNSDQSQRKFDLCKELTEHLQMNLSFAVGTGDEKETIVWTKDISNALFDIFRSRLSKELRDPAIRLSAVLTDSFNGFAWMSTEWASSDNGLKLFKLVSRLVCIEIGLGLSTEFEPTTMACCFLLLEHIILTLVKEEEDDSGSLINRLTSDEIYSLLTAIKETMSIVMSYLGDHPIDPDKDKDKDIDEDDYQIVLGAVRVLCVWVAEETEALREEIRVVLPFLLKVFDFERKRGSDSKVAFEHMVVTALHSLVTEDEETKEVLRRDGLFLSVNEAIVSCQLCSRSDDVCNSLKSDYSISS